MSEESGGVSRKTVKKCQLSCDEMASIVESVAKDKLSHKEAAAKHRVSPRLVQSIVKKSKTDGAFLNKARNKEQKRRLKLRTVIEQSLKHLDSKSGLHNSQ